MKLPILTRMVILALSVTHSIPSSMSQDLPPEYDHGLGIPTSRPLNTAHRGSSGMFPEHTTNSFQLAIDQGAHAIEIDLAISKDLQLICLHESWMSPTTNADDVFPPERMNTYTVNGQEITDYFSVDFTMAELEAIKLKQRYDFRDPNYDFENGLVTFEDFIRMVQAANQTVAIIAEVKTPSWFNSLEILQNASVTMEELIVSMLNSYGYMDQSDPVIIQSFEESSLRYLTEISSMALSFLTAGSLSDSRLEELSQFCYGITIEKGNIIEVNGQGQRIGVTDLVQRARTFGLKIHTWTTRNEDRYLIWEYGQDPYLEYEDLVMNALVDGVITDFPATVTRYLDNLYTGCG